MPGGQQQEQQNCKQRMTVPDASTAVPGRRLTFHARDPLCVQIPRCPRQSFTWSFHCLACTDFLGSRVSSVIRVSPPVDVTGPDPACSMVAGCRHRAARISSLVIMMDADGIDRPHALLAPSLLTPFFRTDDRTCDTDPQPQVCRTLPQVGCAEERGMADSEDATACAISGCRSQAAAQPESRAIAGSDPVGFARRTLQNSRLAGGLPSRRVCAGGAGTP